MQRISSIEWLYLKVFRNVYAKSLGSHACSAGQPDVNRWVGRLPASQYTLSFFAFYWTHNSFKLVRHKRLIVLADYSAQLQHVYEYKTRHLQKGYQKYNKKHG